MIRFVESIPPWFWIAIIAHGAVLGTVAYLILLERKIASWVQDRIGPNRVGPRGLLQPIADGLKFIFKEDYRPANVDRILFTLAPAMLMVVVIVSIAVIPWGGVRQATKTIPVAYERPLHAAVSLGPSPEVAAEIRRMIPVGAEIVNFGLSGHRTINDLTIEQGQVSGTEQATYDLTITYRWPFQIANLNIGVLFIVAVLSLSVYGIVVGGWASNNKYSFLGGLRATANMISYEIPLGLSILTIVIMFGSLDLAVIVEKQAHYWAGWVPAWNIFCQPVAFLMFLICIHAEANRAPFDTAEAEQELVGGYHTEYSSMRFALFFLGEYAGMITTSAVCVALFFGGWHMPWIDKIPYFQSLQVDPTNPAVTSSLWLCVLRAAVFFAKTMLIIGVFMWVRWSLPRFRFDQIMNLAWRALIPISLAMLFATAITLWAFGSTPRVFMRLNGRLALTLLIVNVALVIATMLVSRIIPAGAPTNRRLRVEGSRFEQTPVPAWTESKSSSGLAT